MSEAPSTLEEMCPVASEVGERVILAFDKPERFCQYPHFLSDLAKVNFRAIKFGERFPDDKGWNYYFGSLMRHGMQNTFIDHRLKEDKIRMADSVASFQISEKYVPQIVPRYMSIDTESGRESLEAALGHSGKSRLVGTTIDARMSDKDCQELYGVSVSERVHRLALFAADVGLKALTCPPREVQNLRKISDLEEVELFVSGIIMPDMGEMPVGDFMVEPAEAIDTGATAIIVGGGVVREDMFHEANLCYVLRQLS